MVTFYKSNMIVKPEKKNNYNDLKPNSLYFVIEGDYYRMINDYGKPYLYPPEIFKVIDNNEPPDWETEFDEDGQRYSYPPEFNEAGFFEDYFDGKEESVFLFWHTINKSLAKTA